MKSLLMPICLVLYLTACGGAGSGSGSASQDAFARCENPRPPVQACTLEIAPVCARLSDGSLSTFDNGCTACLNPMVEGHYPLACAAPVMIACTDPRPQTCTTNFQPVCGQLINGTTETFANACQACGNGSVIGIFAGQCP